MPRVALVRVAAFVPVVDFLRRIGAPFERMLERAGLFPELLARPETLVPLVYPARLIEDAARRHGDDHLGLRLGIDASLSTLGTFGRQIVGTRTLRDALSTAIRISASHNSGERYWIDYGTQEIRFVHRYAHHLAAEGRQAEQYALGLALALCRSVGGPGWRPERVYLKPGLGRGLADVELLADAAVVPDQSANAFVLSPELLRTPLPPAATPAPTMGDDVDGWHASAPAADFVTAVRQTMTPLLARGDVDVRTIADAIGMSVRTLQRRLHGGGATYATLLSDARRDSAATMLTGSRTPIADIAGALGYSHPAHFTRAFLRWTGTTPQRFRARHTVAAPRGATAAR